MHIKELLPLLSENSAQKVSMDEVAMFSEVVIDFREKVTEYMGINHETFKDLVNSGQLSRSELISIIENL